MNYTVILFEPEWLRKKLFVTAQEQKYAYQNQNVTFLSTSHNTTQSKISVMSDFKADAIDQANALKEEGNKFLSGLSSLSLSAIVVFLIHLFYSLKEHK